MRPAVDHLDGSVLILIPVETDIEIELLARRWERPGAASIGDHMPVPTKAS